MRGAFAKLTSALALSAATALGGCVTTVARAPESCMGGGGVGLLFVGFNRVSFDEKCAAYQKERQQRTADTAIFTALMNDKNPVSQALGFLMYQAQRDPGAREALEKSAGGREFIRVEPQTVAGLLAGDDNSRYVGIQIYSYSSTEDRKATDDILKKAGHDPRALLTLPPLPAAAQDKLAQDMGAYAEQVSRNAAPAAAPVAVQSLRGCVKEKAADPATGRPVIRYSCR